VIKVFKGAVVADGLMAEIKYPLGAVVVLKPVVTVGVFTAPYSLALVVTERVPRVVTVTMQVAPHAERVVATEIVAAADNVYVPAPPKPMPLTAVMVVPAGIAPPATVIPALMTPESIAETVSVVPVAVAVKIAASLEIEKVPSANALTVLLHANVGMVVKSAAVVIIPQDLTARLLPVCIKYT